MRRRIVFLLLALALLSLTTACGSREREAQSGLPAIRSAQSESGSTAGSQPQASASASSRAQDSEKADASSLTLQMGEQAFTVTLYDTPTTQALLAFLPLDLDMRELNGNEKYASLPGDLPTDSEHVGEIRRGDFMLYGSDCLVLFYESFATSYSYTPLGRVNDPDGFAQAAGGGDVHITFSR